MTSTHGPKPAGAGANDAAAGTVAWANPGNITADDAAAAQVGFLGTIGAQTHYLVATAFAFAIPLDLPIRGVEALINEQANRASACTGVEIKLVKAGLIAGTSRHTGAFVPTSEAVATYGGPADLWGLSLTPQDVNAAGFGVALRYDINTALSTVLLIDQVRLTVYAGDAPWPTALHAASRRGPALWRRRLPRAPYPTTP